MPPKSPKLNALITILRESYSSVSMSRESKRLKKSRSNWLNSDNALIQRVKNAIFVFPILAGNAEAQVIWAGIVNRLLIPSFIGRICAKNIKNPFTYVKVIASQRWDVFWDTVYILCDSILSGAHCFPLAWSVVATLFRNITRLIPITLSLLYNYMREYFFSEPLDS